MSILAIMVKLSLTVLLTVHARIEFINNKAVDFLCIKKTMFKNPKIVFRLTSTIRRYSAQNASESLNTVVNKKEYKPDSWTNVSPNILSYISRNIYLQKNHPLSIIRKEIVDYFHKAIVNSRGNAIFSVYDQLDPVVSIQQNFDDLLIPEDHISRKKSDSYYLNKNYLLRAHMTAYQVDLLKSGLDNYLMIGDVYRRDAIDCTHFPVFHQLDAVRTIHRDKLFKDDASLQVFETNYNPMEAQEFDHTATNSKCIDQNKQPCHTLEAVKLVEHELKTMLVGLARHLFGRDLKYRWVDAYFPFTHPSWELEIFHEGQWLEVLGSGIMRNEILEKSGVRNSIGWAFGLGLERLAMVLFKIPDIRLFWSQDSGFLCQFNEDLPLKQMIYKPVSVYPQCYQDISFWLPENITPDDFAVNDFHELVRNVGGDIVEQVCSDRNLNRITF